MLRLFTCYLFWCQGGMLRFTDSMIPACTYYNSIQWCLVFHWHYYYYLLIITFMFYKLLTLLNYCKLYKSWHTILIKIHPWEIIFFMHNKIYYKFVEHIVFDTFDSSKLNLDNWKYLMYRKTFILLIFRVI